LAASRYVPTDVRIRGYAGALAFAGLVISACAPGRIGDAERVGPEPQPSSPAASGTPPEPAAPVPVPLPVPLLRLTTRQYNRTIQDLFPSVAIPALSLPLEVSIGGFSNNARSQAPSPDLIEQLANNAHQVGVLATADLTKILACTATSSGQETPCGHRFVADFFPRAYRRPLDADESARALALFDDAHLRFGLAIAIRMTIEAALVSPKFIYLVEEGTLLPDGHYQLTSFELASRMSYLLWDTMPDPGLYAAAASGKLIDDPGEIDRQAARLLQDSRAHDAVARFHEQWLRFDKFDGLTKDSTLYPRWNDALANRLRAATAKYVDYAFWAGGNLNAFLTDDHAFATDALAWIYGIPSPGTSTLTLVTLDPSQRSGVLTQPGLMAAFAHPTVDAPILRGVFVRDRLLCLENGTPPPGTPMDTPPPSANAQTTRQRVEQLHADRSPCSGCHTLIDGVGFGFEHYDAVGAWRTTDSGQPVDATGDLVGSGAATDGSFDGAIQLGKKLAASGRVADCVAEEWTRYALGLDRSEINDAMTGSVKDAFSTANLDFRALLAAVVKSDAFRIRVREVP
jgi:hypothetical protein